MDYKTVKTPNLEKRMPKEVKDYVSKRIREAEKRDRKEDEAKYRKKK